MNWLQDLHTTHCHPDYYGRMRKRLPLFSLLPKFLTDDDDSFHPWSTGTIRVDVRETDENFELLAELPGRSEEGVDVEVSNNVLTISSKVDKSKEEEEKGNYRRRERHFESFSRSFDLPDNIDKKKISASFKNGILTIQLPRTPESKPQKIQISS